MSNKLVNKTSVLFTASILLLALILVAVAMWSETLRLNAVVSTGEVDVEFSDWYCSDVGPDPQAPGFHNEEEKDVGSCVLETATIDNVEHLMITIYRGYPGYQCTVSFEVKNVGTIPVIGPFYSIGEVPEELNVTFNPPSIQQLHPGDSAQYEIIVEVLQEASESSTYVVSIDITYIQWNEAYSSISGYVWNDVDEDGIWDPGENPVGGVNVLLEQGGIVIASTYTDINGYYSFSVYPGTYIIRIVLPTGYVNTTALTISRTVSAGESSINNNFGIMQPPTPPPPPPPPPPPELKVTGEFRKTNTDFKRCPVKLGTPLYQVNATVVKENVKSAQPGAFYHVLWINGTGLRNINITITYDYQFNIEDGPDGKIRVYMLNTTTMCVIKELGDGAYTYSVNNTSNRATVNITLSNPLPSDAVILVYTKFKPTDYDPVKEPNGLIGHPWDTLDKSFEVGYNVVTDIGSATGISIIQIVKK